jgi:MFS family permease
MNSVLILAMCQALAMTGTSLIIASSALVGHMLAESKELATLPVSMLFLATTFSTIPASFIMRRRGRKAGFQLGALIGSGGAILAAYALFAGSFVLFCAGLAGIGSYNAFALYYRFAAAEVAPESSRARAISWVLAGGVLAAVAGPQLARFSKDWFAPYLFAGGYVALIFLPLLSLVFLRFVDFKGETGGNAELSPRPLVQIIRQPAFIVALGSSMIAYGVMNFLMTATPLAMTDCSLPFSEVAFVIQWHALGMYAPSFITGDLLKRFGVAKVAVAGVALLLACVAVNLNGVSATHYWLALVCLGVGWNFLHVGGTTLLTTVYSPSERAKTQALNEFLVFGTVALTSLSAGAAHHRLGWEMMNWLTVPVSLAALVGVGWYVWVKSARR